MSASHKGALELRSVRQVPRCSESAAHKQAALRYILDAWEEALHDGIEPEMLANAALFAALTDLISGGERRRVEIARSLASMSMGRTRSQ
jgi:ABC-type hemin transport system ATPase subunit